MLVPFPDLFVLSFYSQTLVGKAIRFPDAIAYGATGGPEYLTDIVILQSGFEQRNQSWDSARARCARIFN
jgi:hypothetical protein